MRPLVGRDIHLNMNTHSPYVTYKRISGGCTVLLLPRAPPLQVSDEGVVRLDFTGRCGTFGGVNAVVVL